MHSDDILLMDCPSQAENFTFLNCKCYWKQWYLRVFVGFWIRYPNNSHTSRNVFWGWIFFWGGVHLEIFCTPLPNIFSEDTHLKNTDSGLNRSLLGRAETPDTKLNDTSIKINYWLENVGLLSIFGLRRFGGDGFECDRCWRFRSFPRTINSFPLHCEAFEGSLAIDCNIIWTIIYNT